MPNFEKKIFRIIDANANRSREGLRVCEEITRFILSSKGLTKELKGVRHRITDLAKEVSRNHLNLLDARDARTDIGRRVKVGGEKKRTDYADVFAANMERVKESLRALEEFSKLIDDKISRHFSDLRFKVYDIEKRAVKKIESLRDPR